eukprot:CAMPEP_0169144546 /NCGR_PEP_ID=MMETSP1015-20121227/46331_1 /TAXON_ID=342587 /ORGANISM="Karlodinium micrum, Strain CCMP2283" /LENGTH=206 /DNA_ID=CAMNT_0009211867 /DNA_START=1 /DNA_END=618 /DNA_ORIENTATION=-
MVKVSCLLTLYVSACLGRRLQIDEEHIKIENAVGSLKTLLTATNSEFRRHRQRYYLVARAPLRSRSLGRLRGGVEGVQSSSGRDKAHDDSDDTGIELAKLGYSETDIAKLSLDRIPTILKMNIKRPASGVPREWYSSGAKKGKAKASKSRSSLSAASKRVLSVTGATVLLGALRKVVTGKSRKQPIEEVVVDNDKGGFWNKFDDFG